MNLKKLTHEELLNLYDEYENQILAWSQDKQVLNTWNKISAEIQRRQGTI